MNAAMPLGKRRLDVDAHLMNGDTCSITAKCDDGRTFTFLYAPTGPCIATSLEVFRFVDSLGREVIVADLVDDAGKCIGKLLEEAAVDRLIAPFIKNSKPKQIKRPEATRKLYCGI